MNKCSQCGKKAMYMVKGHYLCLDCYFKFQSITQQEIAILTAQENNLLGVMESTAGLPLGTLPRSQTPKQTPIINRSINIENSTVGAVNTGYINNMKVNLSEISKSANQELAELIKLLNTFTEEIVKEENISNKIRNEVLEQIDFIVNQLAGKETPKKGIIKSVINHIPVLISNTDYLLKIWDNISKSIINFF